jgi:adenine-specific DNA-methyltransferase
LARNLLTDDGVIFISIDDNEYENLKKVCNEIFGEMNFVENYIWESTFRPDNSSKLYRENAQYVLCFSKNLQKISRLIGSKSGSDGLPSLTKNSMNESVLTFPEKFVITHLEPGIYYKGVKSSGYELLDDVEVKEGIITNSFRLKGRVIWGQEYLLKEIENGTQIIIKSDGFVPYSKKNTLSILAPNTMIPNDLVSDVLSGRAEVSSLFNAAIFDYPKPTSLIMYLINCIDDDDFIVLDFFSGSASTAHSVMKLNSIENKKCKFILTQIPELTNKDSLAQNAGYKNICEIGKERIRRAANKIKEEKLKKAEKDGIFANFKDTQDYGFRVYRLDESNMQDVYYKPQEYKQASLELFADNVKPDRTADDLLAQVMLDWGLPLSLKIEQVEISGKQVFKVAENSLYASFDKNIDEEFAKELATSKPLRVVFRDAGFKDDTAKTNVKQLLKQLSPETEMKVI